MRGRTAKTGHGDEGWELDDEVVGAGRRGMGEKNSLVRWEKRGWEMGYTGWEMGDGRWETVPLSTPRRCNCVDLALELFEIQCRNQSLTQNFTVYEID